MATCRSHHYLGLLSSDVILKVKMCAQTYLVRTHRHHNTQNNTWRFDNSSSFPIQNRFNTIQGASKHTCAEHGYLKLPHPPNIGRVGGPGPKMSNFYMAQNHILSVPIPSTCYQFYVSKKELKKIDLFLPYGASQRETFILDSWLSSWLTSDSLL